ncbi:MAG: hypothetical protein JWN01_1287 [Patescibacteria group bacterium]|nr:hypothetical protein [Patescibacteria group bacterium]
MDTILIDVGSSTVKVNKIGQNKDVRLLATCSIPFKKDFDPATGLSEPNKGELYQFVQAAVEQNPGAQIRIIATALFRELERDARIKFVDEFFAHTGLYFNIISQDLENFYLETALLDKCSLNEPVLLINIGGGSTELVVVYGKDAIERHNIGLGVGTLLGKFPTINGQTSGAAIGEVVSYATSLLPELENNVRVAFYNGGELTYMRLAGYPVAANHLFTDGDHKYLIRSEDFYRKNEAIFHETRLSWLEEKMPHDPRWMHGARSCSAIAEAICRKYGIRTIVPSDSNTAHGWARQVFRTVTLSGSFRKHLNYILDVKKQLEEQGIRVLSPRFIEPQNPGEEFVVFHGEDGMTPLELERHHLESIERSDALVVCNPDGYVGASAFIEIGYAHPIGKHTIFTEKPEEFMLKTLPAQIGL